MFLVEAKLEKDGTASSPTHVPVQRAQKYNGLRHESEVSPRPLMKKRRKQRNSIPKTTRTAGNNKATTLDEDERARSQLFFSFSFERGAGP